MNDGWSPVPDHDRWEAGPTSALAEAVGLVEQATDRMRASGDVEWEARAAELYRAAVAETLQVLVQDRELLDATVQQARACQAMSFEHSDRPGQARSAAVPHPDGGRPW